MKKFKFLIFHGLKRRLFKKSFVITNVILGLLIVGLVNVPAIISLFDSDEETIQPYVIVINQTTDENYPLETTLVDYFNRAYEDDVYVIYPSTLPSSEAFWETENLEVMLIFTGDLTQPDIEVYIKEDTIQNFVLANIQSFLNDYQGIQYANYTFAQGPSTREPGEGIDPDTRMFVEGIITVLMLPVFILIILTTQFLGVDIIEEKSTKAIETIISSVPAKIHFLSKIIVNISFLVAQSMFLLLFGVIGFLISLLLQSGLDIDAMSLLAEFAQRVPNWPGILVSLVSFMILGTLFYLTLAALVAAIATTQEDYQQFQAPLIFTLLGGFYIAIFLPIIGLDSAIRVFAYIPLFSPLVAPVAFATGVISGLEIVIIFVLLIGFVVLFMYIISPIYRVAILSYEETKFLKRISFYVKKAFFANK
ncbi:ABC transporter permease [Liberiplasma polymorphum]|uniref:ABC transporter permease n=1 Tax=Liberiplasma polymorphum TaxID=3374570 RepID=UPI0037725826